MIQPSWRTVLKAFDKYFQSSNYLTQSFLWLLILILVSAEELDAGKNNKKITL